MTRKDHLFNKTRKVFAVPAIREVENKPVKDVR